MKSSEGIERMRNGPLLVYGARLAGISVHSYLKAIGIEIAGFLDRDAKALQWVKDCPVVTAEQWAGDCANDLSNATLIMGLFNSRVDQEALVGYLRSLGYRTILSLVDFVRLFPDNQPFRYWLVDPRFYEENAPALARFRARLVDTASRELLDDIVGFRTGNGHWHLPPPSPHQYSPRDVPAWPKRLRLIDCGAYTGDTVQELLDCGYEFDALATFEPNLQNYFHLTRNIKGINATHFPCGVSDSNRLSAFDSSSDTGGHLSDFPKGGTDTVVCVRLDDALPEFSPNLIKMDIEGEEPAALLGGRTIIERFRPNLAICVYHRADHLWSICDLIDQISPGYSFYLRSHARNTFEVVLYAITSPLQAGQS